MCGYTYTEDISDIPPQWQAIPARFEGDLSAQPAVSPAPLPVPFPAPAAELLACPCFGTLPRLRLEGMLSPAGLISGPKHTETCLGCPQTGGGRSPQQHTARLLSALCQHPPAAAVSGSTGGICSVPAVLGVTLCLGGSWLPSAVLGEQHPGAGVSAALWLFALLYF